MLDQPLDEISSDPLASSPSAGLSGPIIGPRIITDLEGLRSLGKSRSFRSREPIVIRLPDLSAAQTEELTSRINGYRNECGCSLGAKTMTAGLVVMLIFLCASYGAFTTRFLMRLPFAFLVAFVCAGAGKATGILLARRRLRLELDQL